MNISDYLSAKYPLDERSLNRPVRNQMIESLAGRTAIYCLDVGTGAGAMLKRLLESVIAPSLFLTGLDRQPDLLSSAGHTIEQQLRERGYAVSRADNRLKGERNGRIVELDLISSPLADFSAKPASFDLITAHGFMDIVPLRPATNRFADWLAPGGLLYATLNYDGGTTLFPTYWDEAFEGLLLARYDESMEQRRVGGLATGGSQSGRRLHAVLESTGFNMLAYGSSDWNITPVKGAYRDQDALCLQALLNFIREEGEAVQFDADALSRWYTTRLSQIEEGRLGLIVHQVDILAAKPCS